MKSCDEVRELYFELRHGNVDGATQEGLERHLVGCALCQEHVDKLDGMLDEAILWQPAAAVPDKDRLFEGILGQIDGADKPQRADEEVQSSEEAEDIVVSLPPRRGERRRQMLPWLRIALAAAALVVATMSWPKVIVEFVSGESDTIFKELGAAAEERLEEGFVEELRPAYGEESVVERPGPLALRLNAERALRDGEFSAAAGYYEELLGVLSERDRNGGSIRLNLARIYHVHLEDGERAAEHLRIFAATWPEDPVTPQALAEICQLAPSEDDGHCRN